MGEQESIALQNGGIMGHHVALGVGDRRCCFLLVCVRATPNSAQQFLLNLCLEIMPIGAREIAEL